MEVVVEVGAGLDVHKKRIVACCIDGRSNPVKIRRRTFGTFSQDLRQLLSWLLECGCTHVAMESTGVYWVGVYRVLEGSLKVVLGNARHMANVPGRKTDVNDAEWIAQLLRHGLIKPNFVPTKDMRELRMLTRSRRKLVQLRTSSQLRVDKLLQMTNIKLSSVASEIFGVSGRQMLRAMAQGTTNPVLLAEMSRGKLRNKRQDLQRAFEGAFSQNDAALLTIQLDLIGQVEIQIGQLEQRIDVMVEPYADQVLRLQTLPGFGRTSAIDVLAEIGTDMSAWPTADHFIAWSGTCPGNRETAGKQKSAKARPGNEYLKTALCQAATAAARVKGSFFARQYVRLKSHRRDAGRAVVALARELAQAIFHMMRRGENYKPPAIADPAIARERHVRQRVRELEKLGYRVTLT